MEDIKTLDSEKEYFELKEIFKDVFRYAPSKACGTLGNALVVPVYTCILTTEEYGLYSLSIALLSFLCIIFSDWIGLSGLRFFKKNQMMQNLTKYLSTLMFMLTVNLITMFVLVSVFHEHIEAFFKIPLYIIASILLLIIPVAVRALLFQLLRAQLKSWAYTFSTILNQILTIVLSVVFVKVYHLGALSMLLGMAVSITITDVILLFQSGVLKKLDLFSKIEFKFIFPIMKYGVPIAATSLAAWTINQSNKFIMNNINGFNEVGMVGVAYGLTLPILMTIFSTITVAAIPRIYNLYEEKYDVTHVISMFIGYYTLIALPLVMTMAIFSQDYIHVFSANSNFYSAFKIIPYFAFGTFFLSMTDYTTLQYHLANKTHIDFILKLISGIVCIVLNIVLIPKYSLIGVGIATLAANLLYLLSSLLIVIPGLRLHYEKSILNKVLISLVPFVACILIFKVIDIPACIKLVVAPTLFYLSYWYLAAKKKVNQ